MLIISTTQKREQPKFKVFIQYLLVSFKEYSVAGSRGTARDLREVG